VSRDADYLKHIRDSITRIETYVAVGEERFFSEPHWQDAVIRQLEIIGEATKRLSPALRSRRPEVSWRRMSGMRDFLIHNYIDVEPRVVWDVTQQSLPELKQQIEAILRDEEHRS
jgi:uncharacterized protein with HEPN domain